MTAEKVARAQAETPISALRAVGDFLNKTLPPDKKFQMWIEYLTEARRWRITVLEAGKTIGYVTYADHRIIDVYLVGVNWQPPEEKVPTFSLAALVPRFNFMTIIALGALMGILFFGDFRSPFGYRNIIIGVIFLLFAVGEAFNPVPAKFVWGMFAAIVLFFMAIRAPRLSIHGCFCGLARPLIFIPALLVGVIMFSAIWNGEVGDDTRCGTIGARYIIREHSLPYGADISPAGNVPHDRNTYGPLFYLTHVPAEALVPTTYQAQGIRTKVGEAGWTAFFDRMTMNEIAPRITVSFFTLAWMAAVVILGVRAGGIQYGAGWLCVAALVPPIADYGFTGHIISATFVLWAVVLISRPFLAGLFLGAGAGTLFYPAFAIPLWTGWYARRGPGAAKFLTGVAVAGLGSLAVIILFTKAPSTADALKYFLKDTLFVQEGAQGMAGQKWGFWPNFPAIAPLHWIVLGAYLLFCIAVFFRPRLVSQRELLAWTAAVFIGTQFWKSFGPGYTEWYYTLLIMAIFWPGKSASRENALATAVAKGA